MTCTLIMGCSAGDEGKGRIVDYFAGDSDVVVRYGGGSNAGHTLVVNGKKYISRLLPSGYMRLDKQLVIAQGVMLDVETLMSEISALPINIRDSLKDRLFISNKANLVLPIHKSEDRKDIKIGTTGRGIGPAVVDKVRRVGLRTCDLSNLWKFRNLLLRKASELGDSYVIDVKDSIDRDMSVYESFMDMFGKNIIDTASHLNKLLDNNQKIVLEGAQASLLDIDHGAYPYVTSTTCVAGGASIYTGIPMKRIDKVIGVFKAYVTKVGNGPFPTEFEDEISELIAEKGNEFGSVTKRPRRIGWLDLPALRYACMINGFDELIMTKFDVLQGLPTAKYATEYFIDGRYKHICGPDAEPEHIKYSEFDANINDCRAYIKEIQPYLSTPITMYSDSPERDAIHTV